MLNLQIFPGFTGPVGRLSVVYPVVGRGSGPVGGGGVTGGGFTGGGFTGGGFVLFGGGGLVVPSLHGLVIGMSHLPDTESPAQLLLDTPSSIA